METSGWSLRRDFAFIFGVFKSLYEMAYTFRVAIFNVLSWWYPECTLLISWLSLAGPPFDLGSHRLMAIIGMLLVSRGLFMISLSTAYYLSFLRQGTCEVPVETAP